MDKIYVIITGPERNGTTYLSKLICSIPDIYCGFETGLLLYKDFNKCIPFNEWIFGGGEHWGVSNNVNFFDSNLLFDNKYKLLYKYKGYKNTLDIHQRLIYSSRLLVDKTPAYFRKLDFVYKNSMNIPILISIKYFEGYYYSQVVKRFISLKIFKKLILQNIKILNWLKKEKPKNIFLFRYKDIIKPKFCEILKRILPKKINLDNIEINYTNYLKKIQEYNTNYAYKNWKETKYNNIEIKMDKKLIKIYNNLIDDIYYRIDDNNNLINNLNNNISIKKKLILKNNFFFPFEITTDYENLTDTNKLINFINNNNIKNIFFSYNYYLGIDYIKLCKKIDVMKNIYTFDSHDDNFFFTNKNIFKNNITNLKLFNLILSDIDDNKHLTKINFNSKILEPKKAITLDTFLKTYCIEKYISLIFLEYNYFKHDKIKGCLDTIKKFKPILFLYDVNKLFNDYILNQDLLKNLGYQKLNDDLFNYNYLILLNCNKKILRI